MMKEHLERDDYILCPICGKEKFLPEDYFIFCNHCGWEGNFDVDDNMVELNGYSAKDYRKIYQEYLKDHPNYIWKDDKNALNNFVDSFKDYGSNCPVCGTDSLAPDYRYCYKCGWKYNIVQAQFPDFDNSSNKLSLNDYKENYKAIIESNPDYFWKETSEAKIPFDDKQVEWLKENSIKEFDKLTSEKEIHSIIDSIVKIQRQYENKEGYEMYMFIKSILDLILDSI